MERHPDAAVDPAAWPDSIPAVTQLLTEGLELPAGVTFLVGANGAGKSTIVEAVAEVLGVHPEGGSSAHRAGADRGRGADRSGLAARLRAVRSPGRRGSAFFLRAETAHRFYTYLEDAGHDGEGPPPVHPLHRLSHGEGFGEVLLRSRWVREASVLLLDEPESALSFENQLLLGASLAQLAGQGRQVLCATHSPLLTALPGAHVLQLDERGATAVEWEELDLVREWRFFLDAPQRYWRHLP
ncbi:AAA family ATPase [Kineococcus indalonis]|uniref:AAA family ATPase n=1 Tax=Kineococcus indalonis TaxID=2696566 RepID=UPI002B1BD944|nr:AAA family ATPase [Kineococcus indalonis]